MKYFAYGSNMSLSRLKARTPSAKRIGRFILEQHELRFHKISKDGSGKCDAFQTKDPHDFVIGALFEIHPDDKINLDRAEGLGAGYEEKQVKIKNDAGNIVEAFTYYATQINQSLQPYSWYLNHVIIGAKETNVPDQYLIKIQSIECIEDMDKNRDAEQQAIHS